MFSLESIIIHNRAPFKHIELDLKSKSINVLSSLNGGGKTTILSHIADSWYEIVRIAYRLEFEGKENKYYRVSSSTFNLDTELPSIVYLRYNFDNQIIDYIDVRNKCTNEEYDEIVSYSDKIPFEKFQNQINNLSGAKYVSEQKDKTLEKIFLDNLVTYFPAYRHEKPGFLNEPFNIKINYSLSTTYSGRIKNPIEVISGLPQLANWLMDILLDNQMYRENTHTKDMYSHINQLFSSVLSNKTEKSVSIGVGNRSFGVTRIQIGERDRVGNWTKCIYPSIFNMSSGENALICIFGEILRQFDNIDQNNDIGNATGIVLIDEIDKHLHIKIQKDILPLLFDLFPNIQFIISSHSPFVSLGLQENSTTQIKTNVIDLDLNGIIVDTKNTNLFKEAYDVMICENQRFRELFYALEAKSSATKLQIVSEGNNGKHIKRAIEILAEDLIDKVEFSFSDKTGWEQLKNAYDAISKTNPSTKYLFVFDCDCGENVKNLIETNHFYRYVFEKNTEDFKASKGIENLYASKILSSDLYIEKIKVTDYGGETKISELDKNKLILKIQTESDKSIFFNFLPLIEKIILVLE